MEEADVVLSRCLAEMKRAEAAKAAAERERQQRAAEAAAKLERLKAGWKENQTLQAAAAAGDAGAIGKKKAGRSSHFLMLC